MRWIRTIFVNKTGLRGWAVVNGYFKEIWWLSLIATMIAHLISGNAGRAEMYLNIMYSTVVPIYAIRTYIELRGRNFLPRRRLHEKIVASVFIPVFGCALIIGPWWLLASAYDNVGRSHLVYLAMRESLIGLAFVGAAFAYVAVLMLYGIFGALPLIWTSTNRR